MMTMKSRLDIVLVSSDVSNIMIFSIAIGLLHVVLVQEFYHSIELNLACKCILKFALQRTYP